MHLFGVTLNQFVKTGVLAVLFILALKMLAEKLSIPGLQSITAAI